MNIQKSMENEKILLTLSGRLDTTTAPEFQKTLLEEIKNDMDILLDFSSIAYVSSAGLRALLAGQKAIMPHKKTMVLRCVSEEVMDVFDMTGFSDILEIEE